MWYKSLKKRDFSVQKSEDKEESIDRASESTEENKWNYINSNRNAIQKQLKLTMTIKAIRYLEKIKIDFKEVIDQAATLQIQLPKINVTEVVEDLCNSKEVETVLDWLGDKAKIEYYQDNTPVKIKVEMENTENLKQSNQTLKNKNLSFQIEAFPPGANEIQYRQEYLDKIKSAKKTLNELLLLRPNKNK